MQAGFGPSAESVAQFGPSVLARNDVGEGDTNFEAGQKRTSWATQLGIYATFGGNWREPVSNSRKGWFRRKLHEIAKAGHPRRGWK